MLADALAAPTRSADALGTLLVGGGLLLLSVLFPVVWVVAVLRSPVLAVLAPLAVFPPLVLLGYDVRVLRAGAEGDDDVPSLVSLAGLVRLGIGSLLVRALYLFPLAVVVGGAGAVVGAARADLLGLPELQADAVVLATTVFAGLFAVAYLFAYLYIGLAALSLYGMTGRLRVALSPRHVLAVALSRTYAVGWTLTGTVVLVGLLVALPLQLLLVGFPLAFYVRTAGHHLAGQAAAPQLVALGLLEAASTPEPASEPPVGRDAAPNVQVGRSVPVESAGPEAFEWRFDDERSRQNT